MKRTGKILLNHTLFSRCHRTLPKSLVSVAPRNIDINGLIRDTARVMSRPTIWTDAWNHLSTLRSNMWIDSTVANFYLSHVWYDGLAKFRIRYLEMYSAMATKLLDVELDSIRRYHFIPQDVACTVAPVGFVVHHGDHFFTVIFDYARHTAHILGRHISNDTMHVDKINADGWKVWGGPGYWIHIAAIHGWTAGDPTNVIIRALDWEQNGVDCGPIACSVLEQVMTAGLDEDGNVPQIHIECGHLLRMKIFRIVSAQIVIRCRDYMMLLDNAEAQCMLDEMPDEDVINAIQHGQHPTECQGLLESLAASSATCEACRHPTLIQKTRDHFQTDENNHGVLYDDINQFENEGRAESNDVPQGKFNNMSLEKDEYLSIREIL